MNKPYLTVIMPVFNEQATIVQILEKVDLLRINKQIVIVDDASTDDTFSLITSYTVSGPSVIVCESHERNRGKGAAIRTALGHATGKYVLIQDADLEYDPDDYPRLLQPLEAGLADVVYGSRFLGGTHRVCFFWHRVANALLTNLSNMTTNLNLTDMEVCFKVFRLEVIKSILLRCNRFDFEPEVTAKISRWNDPESGKKCRVYEVPVNYYGRDYSEGKKIGLKDAFQAVFTIIRYSKYD
jgi:glycosyltransferase involved in cell wall biosynthesis